MRRHRTLVPALAAILVLLLTVTAISRSAALGAPPAAAPDGYRVLLPAAFNYTPAFTATRVIAPGARVTSLLFEPDAPAHGYAYAEDPVNALLETVDAGQAWTPVSSFPLRNVTMHPLTHAVLYATGSTSAMRSPDAGHSWEYLAQGPFNGPLSGIGVHPVSPTVLFVGAHSWEPGLYNGQIFRSTDYGQSWSIASDIYANAQTFAFDPVTPTIMYAGSTSRGVLKSTNNGAWWQLANHGINAWVHELLPAAENPGRIYAATGAGVYVSYDRADHWQVLWAGLSTAALARSAQDPATLYAGTVEGIFVSYNAGGSWYPLGPCAANTSVNRLAFSQSSPPVLWAATNDGLWECRNE